MKKIILILLMFINLNIQAGKSLIYELPVGCNFVLKNNSNKDLVLEIQKGFCSEESKEKNFCNPEKIIVKSGEFSKEQSMSFPEFDENPFNAKFILKVSILNLNELLDRDIDLIIL